jgi:tetratricopeptide (TPR) repeat protein
MSGLFISHSTDDDGFVRGLQRALDDFGAVAWTDSRRLCGGDLLWSTIHPAIENADAFVVVVSPHSLQSKWVGKELRHALEVRKRRADYRVIPLSLDGTRLGVLEEDFGEEPVYIPVSREGGGIEAALDAILTALGKRLPADRDVVPQPAPEPLEELVLHLTDLRIDERDGVRRPSARARLVYHPARPEQPEVTGARDWRLTAPMGPIEADDLRWYLEKYAIWPGDCFRDRAARVEASLARWGQDLHQAAMPIEHTANVMQAWARIGERAERRFSVYVEDVTVAGATATEIENAREAATLLLGLPWELLHDGDSFLFQGARPTRVRRRLPNTADRQVPVLTPPIRVLLITSRPEDDACDYINHRASALPLVQAMEALGGLVELHLLDPPTLQALDEELHRAHDARRPYHVVHFDGHGVFNRQVGLGGLCFEDPADVDRLEGRRHQTVFTDKLGPLLRDHRVPLVFLEACQTAQAERASESVATQMLKEGVVSVVAMSHSVLVETARRFVESFYRALADGRRVGAAMLAGQRALKDDDRRGRRFGVGDFRLQDWFVPVLYQEKADPQLFARTPAPQTKQDTLDRIEHRMGMLPKAPGTGFVGRSRELLALQRLLATERYAVVRGQGGEGKTALAAEFARWLVRSQKLERAAFVSVEVHSHVRAVLDAIGSQLVPDYSVATFSDLEQAILPVERALRERSTVLVVDNMESILAPPYIETPAALSEETRLELQDILNLCQRLNAVGDTRLVFTSREPLPSPFDGERNRRELHRLSREDAVALVERVLGQGDGGAGQASPARDEAIGDLVEAVHGHARTLTLLAPSLRAQGVEKTRESLTSLMDEMERAFPGNREKSLFASVELSLRRMSPENQQRARVLGVFHGVVDLDMLRAMMKWEIAEVADLAKELVTTGLATVDPYNHLTLNPALCPYLRARLGAEERAALEARWGETMSAYVDYLVREASRRAEIASRLALLELPNLLVLLEQRRAAGDGEATIGLTTSLHGLLHHLDRPRLLRQVSRARDDAEAALGAGLSHARFEVLRTRIEQMLSRGRLEEAGQAARDLLHRARVGGEGAYIGADFDLATACFLLGRVLQLTGRAEQALPLVDEARGRFEDAENREPGRGAERMASLCVAERGDSLRDLGRLDDAIAAYEEGIREAKIRRDERAVAVGSAKLGRIRLLQRRYPDALLAYREARDLFARLGEPMSVAETWQCIGLAYANTGEVEAAEDAYRQCLAISVQLDNPQGQTTTLGLLAILYERTDRAEDAVTYHRQAADAFARLQDAANEGRVRNNLADCLRTLRRFDEARTEIHRASECTKQFGHACEPWKTWAVLADIEKDAGAAAAAEQARRKAIGCYLAYRRDGGENHDGSGRLVAGMTEHLHNGGPEAAAEFLEQVAVSPDASAPLHSFIEILRSVINGSRDRALAETADLSCAMAAEVLLLIEQLEKAEGR